MALIPNLRPSELDRLVREVADRLIARPSPFPPGYLGLGRLPNLRISRCDAVLGPGAVGFDVDVINDGQATSEECELQGTFFLVPSDPQAPVAQVPVTKTVPPLRPGSTHRLRPFHSEHINDDVQFVNITLFVDPPTPGHPGGKVWESDETDNHGSGGVYTTPQWPEEGEPSVPADPTPPDEPPSDPPPRPD